MQAALNELDLFKGFREYTDCIVEATRLVKAGFARDGSGAPGSMEGILKLECTGNRLLRTCLMRLGYTPASTVPYGREDLYRILWHFDDILNALQALASRILAFRITKFTGPAIRMAEIIDSCGAVLPSLVEAVGSGASVSEPDGRIYQFQEEAQGVFLQAMTSLFDSEKDPVELIKRKDTYELLAQSVGSFEAAAKAIEDMILKYR